MVEQAGAGVTRFHMLTRKNDAPLDFDFAKVLEQSKDNPVFYVNYAYARVNSAVGKAAAFVDVGRAWGGVLPNNDNPGWLSDVGVGLRVVSDRSSFGTVVHIDLAVPLNRTADVSSVQFQVKTKRSF